MRVMEYSWLCSVDGWSAGRKKLLAKKTDNEIWNIFFGGRYIILLMGLFSIYTGIIYNDIFSKSANVFGSNWNVTYDYSTISDVGKLTLNPNSSDVYAQVPYPVGMDPVWALAENKIIFLNSYKMKLSIIFGVVHMIFGVCVSVINIVHFKQYSRLFFEFLPQLLFLVLLFAYLAALMIIKWFLYDAASKDFAYTPTCAPSVLITLINMILGGETSMPEGCSPYMFAGQAALQKVLVLAALACVPVLLLGKPLWFLFNRSLTNKKKRRGHGVPSQDIELQTDIVVNASNGGTGGAVGSGHSDEHEEDSFGEIMIHQAIHTIEYVLSTVSHTASYLRLWALSLAHAQLSEVLWGRVMAVGLGALEGEWWKSALLFVVFGAWSFFTVAILVMMEGLSAFLHTLRLHWVEFMSKFYVGQGYMFQPFCFKSIMDTEDAEE
uniref:V-type proton ATPase subunit a n=1 Tax=Fopius arisanus TaxID=64838 RepID=A0A0C9PQQ8_9HYME